MGSEVEGRGQRVRATAAERGGSLQSGWEGTSAEERERQRLQRLDSGGRYECQFILLSVRTLHNNSYFSDRCSRCSSPLLSHFSLLYAEQSSHKLSSTHINECAYCAV